MVWENKACPIIGGREEDGVPKIFADIACERHVKDLVPSGYECNTFLSLTFIGGRSFRKRHRRNE
ncbi:hypothetical protein MASR1M66_05870 [Aminivibrio sp.]